MKKILIASSLVLSLNAVPVDWFLNYEYCLRGNAPLEVCNIAREVVSLKNKLQYIKNEKEKKATLCYSIKFILDQYSKLSDSWQKSIENIEMSNQAIIKNSEIEKFYGFLSNC